MLSISSRFSATLVVSLWFFGCSPAPPEKAVPTAAPAPAPAPARASDPAPTPGVVNGAATPNEVHSTARSYREYRLFADDPAPFDHLGWSVAAAEGIVAAGARSADAPATDAGAVYLYRREANGWRQERKLAPVDTVEHDQFGNAVALDGQVLVVGASGHHERGRKDGAVYIYRFERDAWRFEQRLNLPGAVGFGQAVAIDGDLIAVGAPGMSSGEIPSGSVLLFRRSGGKWKPAASLVASDAAPYDLFGRCVGVSGDRVVIGAPSDDDFGVMTGALYVFERDGEGWHEAAKLVPADATPLAELGKTCALNGDLAVGGADGLPREAGKSAGAAFVFRRGAGGWEQEATLLATDAQKADRFGNAVAIDGETIAVGAHYVDDANGLGAGAVYVFERTGGGWQQRIKLLSGSSFVGEELGWSVAVHDGMVVSGAMNGGPNSSLAGVVSIFEPVRP